MMMPKGIELARKAQDELHKKYQVNGIDPFSSNYLKTHCDKILDELVLLEFEIYKIEEQKVNENSLWQVLEGNFKETSTFTKIQIEKILKDNFPVLRDYYKSISQSRVSRAGNSLQNHIAFILEKLNYPFEVQKIVDGKPDFILPNAKLYRNTPGECVLVTAKRTLRERWRQIITEGFKSPQYFLITIDEKQTSSNLKEMAQNRIYLVVPDRIKQNKPSYKAATNVMSLGSFLKNYLDPAMSRWKQVGTIK